MQQITALASACHLTMGKKAIVILTQGSDANFLLQSTASIYFSNGTAVDIAKIEGGPAYKQMMRTTEVGRDNIFTQQASSIDTMASSGLGTLQRFSLQSFRAYLPPWLGGYDIRTQPQTRMLQALKTATESYLEGPLLDAEVVLPFPVADSFWKTLRSACSSISLRMLRSLQSAGIRAVGAYGLRGRLCNAYVFREQLESNQPLPSEQLILTVDYSRAALTALLVYEDCGVYEDLRVGHDTRLGADELYKGTTTSESQFGREDLARAIREITKLPVEEGTGAGSTQIDNLVILGESAGDPLLRDVLKEVLGQRYPHLFTAPEQKSMGVIDPLFAASRGLALDCWIRLDFHDREERGDEL